MPRRAVAGTLRDLADAAGLRYIESPDLIYSGKLDAMPKYACKIDANQPEIVETFQSEGYTVRSTAAIGGGFPDLCITHPDWTFVRLVEVKGPRGKLTGDQRKFIEQGWPVDVVRSTYEVLALCQEWRKQ